MVQTHDAANPGVETLHMDGFLNGVTAPVTDDSAPAVDDAPDADAAIDVPDDAGQADPAPAEPDEPSDPGADEITAQAQAWLKTDEGKAWQRAQRESISEGMSKRVEKALADTSLVKTLSAQERRLYRRLQSQMIPVQADAAAFDGATYAEWYTKHAELQAIRADRYAWADHIAAHPEDEAIWADMVRQKVNVYGVPAEATSDQIRIHLANLSAKLAYQKAQAVTAGLDPNATFDEFMERPEWALLTADEQNALLPDNFEGDPAKIVRAMERAYGKTAAVAEARKARQDAVRKAAGVNGKAAAAQAAVDGGLAPPVANGQAVPSMDFATLRKQYIDAHETGTLTPDLEAAYERADRARKGGSVFFLDP